MLKSLHATLFETPSFVTGFDMALWHTSLCPAHQSLIPRSLGVARLAVAILGVSHSDCSKPGGLRRRFVLRSWCFLRYRFLPELVVMT